MDTVSSAVISGVRSTWVTAIVVSVGPYRLNTRMCGADDHRARMSAMELASPPSAMTSNGESDSLAICGLASSSRR